MSERHTLVTSYLYGTDADLAAVEAVFRAQWRWVEVHRDGRGTPTWMTAMERDAGGWALEYQMLPTLVAALDGLLSHPWTIVVAWETDTHETDAPCERQHVWAVRGR